MCWGFMGFYGVLRSFEMWNLKARLLLLDLVLLRWMFDIPIQPEGFDASEFSSSCRPLINDNKSWDAFLCAQFICEGKQAESVKHIRFFLPQDSCDLKTGGLEIPEPCGKNRFKSLYRRVMEGPMIPRDRHVTCCFKTWFREIRAQVTITPFTRSSGPVWQIGEYAAFLRERQLKRCSPRAVQLTKMSQVRSKGRPPSNIPGDPQPDLTGL